MDSQQPQDQATDYDGEDLVRKTDALIQQLAAARASCGVPPTFASSSDAAAEHEASGGYSVPSEVTIGSAPAGGGDDCASASYGGGATLSTAEESTSFHVGEEDHDHGQDEGGDEESFTSARSTGIPNDSGGEADATTESATQLKKKIMSKYGEHDVNVMAESSTSKKSKKEKKKKKGGKKETSSKKISAKTHQSSSSQHQSTYGADYGGDYSAPTATRATPARALARSTQAGAATKPAEPTFTSPYQQTDESLQEAMRQAEIAEDAARKMREAVAGHQTMDRDSIGGGMGIGSSGMQGFGSSGPGRYGPHAPSSEGPRVGASFLETGATACIREMLRCLADPLEMLAGDNAAPPGASFTGFGSANQPHPSFARASGAYEYVPVPNIRHVFGSSGGGNSASNNAVGRREESNRNNNKDDDQSSERKGLLSGTGYDSNW